ncbi:hypothetical protein [Polaribacter tangerinus]|uniref:hypothetical protein n=1 Tax=Polaribacter tangerinus TaxID=1920034 RepID=UPI000B4B42A7|nr:hypothetical protein [Polaribacter tangerinus]
MEVNIEEKLNQTLDDIIHQLTKGNTIEGLRKGKRYFELHQIKDWKSKYGYQFHIYSNDHLIDKKPHFHIVKNSESIDCRFFFDGTIHDCKGKKILEKKVHNALKYFLEDSSHISKLVSLWNFKNPDYKITNL